MNSLALEAHSCIDLGLAPRTVSVDPRVPWIASASALCVGQTRVVTKSLFRCGLVGQGTSKPDNTAREMPMRRDPRIAGRTLGLTSSLQRDASRESKRRSLRT
jgi:hypothetical protein